MEPDRHVVTCQRGHPRPAGECLVCRKARDDRHRANARLAGKDAERQRRWDRARYQDPVWRAAKLARTRALKQRPENKLSERMGISVPAARAILEKIPREGTNP